RTAATTWRLRSLRNPWAQDSRDYAIAFGIVGWPTGRKNMTMPRALIGAWAALALCALSATAQTKLTVGTAGTAGAALFTAKHEGIFAKHGLDVTILMIKLNPDMPPALMAGSLDVALMTTPTFFQAIDGGLDLVVFVGGTSTSQT